MIDYRDNNSIFSRNITRSKFYYIIPRQQFLAIIGGYPFTMHYRDCYYWDYIVLFPVIHYRDNNVVLVFHT